MDINEYKKNLIALQHLLQSSFTNSRGNTEIYYKIDKDDIDNLINFITSLLSDNILPIDSNKIGNDYIKTRWNSWDDWAGIRCFKYDLNFCGRTTISSEMEFELKCNPKIYDIIDNNEKLKFIDYLKEHYL